MQNVVILGSTGSIGTSTLEVIDLNLDKYRVFALSANQDANKLFLQCLKYNPPFAVLLDKAKVAHLKLQLKDAKLKTELLSDVADLSTIVQFAEVDIVMSAIVGSQGLMPTYQALLANKKVLLANKESLVAAGGILIEALKNGSGSLIPVDSEHSAILQSLPQQLLPEEVLPHQSMVADNKGVLRIILTASGGPFLNLSIEQLSKVTVTEALAHPNWTMGKKITIDSSTLMNKGLELIEAYWLFHQYTSQFDVVIHPQSIIHSMVEYVDGAVLAQLGTPEMKTPIAYALAYPRRIISGSTKLDLTKLGTLTFMSPDMTKFPCLGLAYMALKEGGIMPVVLNAANEVAVQYFLQEQINFYDINKIIERAMHHFENKKISALEEIIAFDTLVCAYTVKLINDSFL